MWQGEEYALQIVQSAWIFRSFLEDEISQPIEVAMNFANWFSRLLVASDQGDFGIRMAQQNAQQLGASIARAAKIPTLILVRWSIGTLSLTAEELISYTRTRTAASIFGLITS